jgi:hypothetical protein
MSYLSSKKIYPGNWNEPLNGWYKNIDTNDSGTNDSSKGGPTSVLATPGFRYFQVRGYVPVTATSGGTLVATGDVIIPPALILLVLLSAVPVLSLLTPIALHCLSLPVGVMVALLLVCMLPLVF